MTQDNTKQTENSISDAISFADAWAKLNRNQRRFCVAMLEHTYKGDAATAIGIKPDTVYRWPSVVDEVVAYLSMRVKDAAVQMLAQGVAKAAAVKLAGLDSENETTRQSVASEILDRIYGRAMERYQNLDVDLSQLTEEQIVRIADGEDILHVLATPGQG